MPPGPPTLYTIGTERRARWELTKILRAAGVNQVLDVRFRPVGRQHMFNKEALREHLPQYGIGYRWCLGFGNRNYRSGPVDLADPFRELDPVKALIAEKVCALMCFCGTHRGCHRVDVAALLASQIPDLTVEHLGETP